MKKFLLVTLVLLFSIGTNVYSESVSHDTKSSKVQELLEILKQKDDGYPLTEFDILNGTSSSRPRVKPFSSAEPVRGFSNGSILKLAISINDIFDVEIVDDATGETVKAMVINSAVSPETLINISDLDKGSYTVYLYGESATEDDDYYYGEFTIE